MKTIFVVDDEFNIREIIKKYLEAEGYKVVTFSNGDTVYEELTRLKPDLIVLDIMMPGLDGIELCKKIRSSSEVPIIFVSAKDEEIDRIIGLEIGGDDYMSKPFSPRELVIRIKNIFKRLDKVVKGSKEEIKDLTMYKDRRYIEKENEKLDFTSKEYELMEFLIENKNIPFTREKLVEEVWGYEDLADLRAIDDLVKRIRKKLKDINSKVTISTVWGYGYRVDD